ncbi:hypothetical protein CPC08DRAFT_763719 [Agrocybe pediades]|nr:hypothetical protein CPC08DRAFT_763719 [Agrocybe pediades]
MPPSVHFRHGEQERENHNLLKAQQPTQRGWSPLKKLLAVKALVPNLSPLPGSSLARKVAGEGDSDEFEFAFERSEPVAFKVEFCYFGDADSQACQATIRRRMKREEVWLCIHLDSQTPTRESMPIVDSSSQPSTLSALDLFSSNKGPVIPPSSPAMCPSAPVSSESVQANEDKEECETNEEKLVAVRKERTFRWISRLEKSAPELSPPTSAPISQPSSAAALSSQEQLKVVQQQPDQTSRFLEPTLAAPSTSAPIPTSSEPQQASEVPNPHLHSLEDGMPCTRDMEF